MNIYGAYIYIYIYICRFWPKQQPKRVDRPFLTRGPFLLCILLYRCFSNCTVTGFWVGGEPFSKTPSCIGLIFGFLPLTPRSVDFPARATLVIHLLGAVPFYIAIQFPFASSLICCALVAPFSFSIQFNSNFLSECCTVRRRSNYCSEHIFSGL